MTSSERALCVEWLQEMGVDLLHVAEDIVDALAGGQAAFPPPAALLTELTERTGERERRCTACQHVPLACIGGHAGAPLDPEPEPCPRCHDHKGGTLTLHCTRCNYRAGAEPERGEGALLPCPFCGGDARKYERQDEDLWSHNEVTWTSVGCADCDVEFSWPPGAEPTAVEQWNTRAASPEPAEREPEWMSGFRKLEQVAAHVCWECRKVTFTDDLWAKDGCPDCGNHGYAFPMVFRPGSGGYQQWLHDTDRGRERYAPLWTTPPAPAGEDNAAPLLFNWLNSATDIIRRSYVRSDHQDDERSLDAAWQHYDPDGFALAVATREYLARVGYAPGPHGGDEAAPQDATGDATTEEG